MKEAGANITMGDNYRQFLHDKADREIERSQQSFDHYEKGLPEEEARALYFRLILDTLKAKRSHKTALIDNCMSLVVKAETMPLAGERFVVPHIIDAAWHSNDLDFMHENKTGYETHAGMFYIHEVVDPAAGHVIRFRAEADGMQVRDERPGGATLLEFAAGDTLEFHGVGRPPVAVGDRVEFASRVRAPAGPLGCSIRKETEFYEYFPDTGIDLKIIDCGAGRRTRIDVTGGQTFSGDPYPPIVGEVLSVEPRCTARARVNTEGHAASPLANFGLREVYLPVVPDAKAARRK